MGKNTEGLIEEKCCYCESASPIRETSGYICNKKGVVSYNFKCKKFVFDPTKLIPVLPARPLEYSPDDFKL